MITGSAPISEEILTFFKVSLGIHIYEGYGQTEATGPFTLTHPRDPSSNNVGGPIPLTKVRFRDVPEMDIYVNQ